MLIICNRVTMDPVPVHVHLLQPPDLQYIIVYCTLYNVLSVQCLYHNKIQPIQRRSDEKFPLFTRKFPLLSITKSIPVYGSWQNCCNPPTFSQISPSCHHNHKEPTEKKKSNRPRKYQGDNCPINGVIFKKRIHNPMSFFFAKIISAVVNQRINTCYNCTQNK